MQKKVKANLTENRISYKHNPYNPSLEKLIKTDKLTDLLNL